ncbi:MAG: hypothetical protein AAGN66_21155 [Acidobacteriota bacterium]
MNSRRVPLPSPDPRTGESHGWEVTLEDGGRVQWRGMYTGPRILDGVQIEHACRELLGCDPGEVAAEVDRRLLPATGERASRPALILHSSTPELKAFEGDLQALAQGANPGDLTTYKETRSVYLARPGDVAVGRTAPWRTAVGILGVEAVELPDVEHYYLSHALLGLALEHQRRPCPPIASMLRFLRRGPRKIKLYSFEPEMQMFLLWLARTAGVEGLAVEANRPTLAAAWNRKSVLHPPVSRVRGLTISANLTPDELLALEASRSDLATLTGIEAPAIPGYTLERRGRDAADFAAQAVEAARMLQRRYGLTTGCLKASEAGDGARITAGLSLADTAALERLTRGAHVHGDDYVLEAHVDYRLTSVAGQHVSSAVSAHVRGGSLAAGATLQFVEGTSWKGNLFLDGGTLGAFRISPSHYRRSRKFVGDFLGHFERRDPGLVLGGVDLAVGKVGGAFGDRELLGVQDLNVSFTGAECLRTFLDKARGRGPELGPYGVTRVYRPRPGGGHGAFLEVTAAACGDGIFADTVASIPGRWAMVGVTGRDPEDALGNLRFLEEALILGGLIEPP